MAAWEMVKDRPWSGVGYGAYAQTYPEYRRKLIVTEFSYQHMGTHSEPLRLLAEVGVPGLLAALWFLGVAASTGLRAFRRSRDPDQRLLSLAVVAGLATYAVHGLFNSYLGYDKVTVPFWIGLGTIAALGGKESVREGLNGRTQSGYLQGM
jgi:O-antigen ligase